MITGQDRVTARGPAMCLTLGPLWALTCELPHGQWTSFCTSFSGSRLMGILGIVLWTLYPSIKGHHSGITCICEISFLSYYKTNRTHISKFIISLVFESYQLTCYPQKSICGWFYFYFYFRNKVSLEYTYTQTYVCLYIYVSVCVLYIHIHASLLSCFVIASSLQPQGL